MDVQLLNVRKELNDVSLGLVPLFIYFLFSTSGARAEGRGREDSNGKYLEWQSPD